MAGIKISALPVVPTAALTDLFAGVQGGITSKETLQQVLDLFQGQITSLAAQVAALNMNSHLINNVLDPVSAQDAATKSYVDTVAQGITVQGACRVATTTALTVSYLNGTAGIGATLTNAGAQAAIAIDGVTLALNDRVLVKNQASTFQNGIYIVTTLGSGATNWVLTRSTDYDQVAEINPGDLVVINAGTVNTGSSWLQTATVVTIGTSAISFSQFTAALPISMANGGTGANLTASVGAIPYSGASAMALLANPAATGKIFQSGNAAAPTWSTATYPSTAGTSGKILISDGTNIISSTPTYPNAAGTSGNYIKSNGTNFVSSAPTTPTVQSFLSGSGTYTTPAGVLYLKVTVVGGGGGGSGSGTGTSGNVGTSGGDSTFGGSITAGGGAAGTNGASSGSGGGGGSATGGTLNYVGQIGGGSQIAVNLATSGSFSGGAGGNSRLFAGGGLESNSITGGSTVGLANTGGGGGGGLANIQAVRTGTGGGGGGTCVSYLSSPSGTYAYAVGAGGTGGTAGTSGFAGGVGGSGFILVEEFYQ